MATLPSILPGEGCSCLGTGDFNKVFKFCKSVQANWYTLATYLDVDITTVEAIESSGERDVAKCLGKVLSAWLKRSSPTQPKPSWRSLCDALAGMGEGTLSERIQREHPCGCDQCKEVQLQKHKNMVFEFDQTKDELQNTKLSLTKVRNEVEQNAKLSLTKVRREVEFLYCVSGVFFLSVLLLYNLWYQNSGTNMTSAKVWTDYKYYFAFGPNLKKARHDCRDSKFYSIGELKNHRLAFSGLKFGSRWNGAVGTVLPAPDESVWGAVWEVTPMDVEDLHIQEGVAIGLYRPIEVDIHTPQHGVIQCLSYVQLPINKPEDLPSLAYMKVIISGAREVGLPSEYIRKLESTPHNGKQAHSEEFNRMAGLIE